MRQLDLFGSFLDTPTEEKKLSEKVPVSKKKEGSWSEKEGASYSLIELAEEKFINKSGNGQDSEAVNLITDFAPQAEQTQVISLSGKDKCLNPELAETVQDQSKTNSESLLVDKLGQEENTFDNLPKAGAKKTERDRAVIFDDGKISVKVKIKPAPAIEIVREAKKEPQKRGRKSLQEIEAEVDLIEVPEDDVLFQKQYYSISQVAQWFRVNTSLLHFWENEFDILKPRKNRKGDRLFRPEDVKNLQLIYQLLRQRKYTMEGAKEYIKTHRKKADIQLQLTTTLQKFRNFLLDLKADL